MNYSDLIESYIFESVNMEKKIKCPEECDKEELVRFKELVLEGGEVPDFGLEKRIKNAYKLIFIYDKGRYIAVGAVKIPESSYKKKVFKKAGVSGGEDKYRFEIGYIYVTECCRGKGVGSILIETIKAAANGESCFGTTREDNITMHKLFEKKLCYKRIGEAYQSERSEGKLVLYATRL